jgi:hypothetical protein
MGAVFAMALACAPPALGQGASAASSARPAAAHKPAPLQKAVHKAALTAPTAQAPRQPPLVKPAVKLAVKKAISAGPALAPKRPTKPAPHHATRAQGRATASSASSGVLAFAGCYGQFIGWRDELSGLMLQANSYTPWPEDRARFDRIEQAFAASAKGDRNLVLTLRPAFKEADFPSDVRAAFRAGLKAAAGRFSAGDYRHHQILVLGQPELSPAARMAQLEANTDEAFAPLAASCERLPPP